MGGEGIAHSRLGAFHGLAGAGAPRSTLLTMTSTHTSTDNPKIPAPTVESWFQIVTLSAAEYVQVRRGIPYIPDMCIGKNVRLKPIMVSQKCHLPSVSLGIRPVTFGNQ